MNGSMLDVEVLVVPDCPNQAGAERLMRKALDAAGLPDVPVRTRVVESEEEAAGLAFTGSPSFRVNGRDPFPSHDVPSLACRLYRTETGLAGLPDPAGMVDAVQR